MKEEHNKLKDSEFAYDHQAYFRCFLYLYLYLYLQLFTIILIYTYLH